MTTTPSLDAIATLKGSPDNNTATGHKQEQRRKFWDWTEGYSRATKLTGILLRRVIARTSDADFADYVDSTQALDLLLRVLERALRAAKTVAIFAPRLPPSLLPQWHARRPRSDASDDTLDQVRREHGTCSTVEALAIECVRGQGHPLALEAIARHIRNLRHEATACFNVRDHSCVFISHHSMLGALDCGADTRACLRPDLHQYHADIHGRIASLADCGTHATTSMGHEYVLAVTCVQHIVSALEQDQGSTSPPPGVVDCLAVVARRPLRPGELMCPTSLEQRLRPPTGYDLVARSAALIERHHTLGEPGWRKSLFIICLTMLGVFESMQRLSDAEAWAADDDDDDQDPFTLRDRLKDEGSQAFAAVARLLGLSWCDSNEDGEDGATNNDKMSWPRACINKFLASGDPTASVLQCRLSATKWFQFRSETLATLP